MAKKLIPMAVCYDFDGTLSPGNMQEYDFIKKLEIKPKDFWAKTSKLAKEQKADEILAYMKLMIDEARSKRLAFRKEDFIEYGKHVQLFEGVEKWFGRINMYAASKGISLSHYIISSGLKEMVEGTVIAKEFKEIFASAFMYDANGAAEWPAVVINYTTKTQYLFRLNKGCCDINDNKTINQYVEPSQRPLPFANMIYIGDGTTDIPCMRLVKREQGHSVAVYRPHQKGAKDKAQKLIKDGRVNLIAPADYSPNKEIDVFVKAVIDKIAADNHLSELMR